MQYQKVDESDTHAIHTLVVLHILKSSVYCDLIAYFGMFIVEMFSLHSKLQSAEEVTNTL